MKMFQRKSSKKEKGGTKRKAEQETQIEATKAKFLADVEHALYQSTSNAMINGMLYERERLYENYVAKIDEFAVATDNWIFSVNELLSFLRIAHVERVVKETSEKRASKPEETKK